MPIKNPSAFLDFARHFQPLVGLPCRFTMIGRGGLEDQVKKEAAAIGLADSIQFCGWQRDMSEVYRDLELVVLTSKNEGTPVALIEAMASGIPACSLDVGGTSDMVSDGRNGVLAGDILSLARRAADLVNSAPIYEALGKQASRDSAETYTFDRLESDLRHLYSELMAKKTSGRKLAC